jgi:3'(2'), 5'-bisphosphate nucleotidase
VTDADRDAEALIVASLRSITPDVPIVAEEAQSVGAPGGPPGTRFWLVDPLDGTKEFISRNGEFTVNVALVEGGRPLLGVVYAPAIDVLFGGASCTGAFRDAAGSRSPVRCRSRDGRGLVVVSSRSHGDEAALSRLLAGETVAATRRAGSSLKFCEVASGNADAYPRLGPTMEWDTAAGHAVLAAAGGEVWSLEDGLPLVYGKTGFRNPSFLAAALPAPGRLLQRHRVPVPGTGRQIDGPAGER